MTAAARKFVAPARFDASSQHRRAMIGKIKLASKEMGWSDDDYRAVLHRVTGQTSCTQCSEPQLIAMLDEIKRLGWNAKPKKAVTAIADHRSARKARALWISLHHLGAIDDVSERALEALARRQLGCAKMQWADQTLMYKLIEALKAMGARHGWDQSTKNATDADHALRIIKVRLIDAILTKLKAAGYAAPGWNVAGAAVQIAGFDKARHGGPMAWDMGELDMIARAFGDLLRTGERTHA